MFNMLSIGKKISNLRKEKNLTQVELADQLGISYQAVSNWERGDSMPDISKLSELAEILEVSIDELLGHNKQTKVIKDLIDDKEIKIQELSEEEIKDVFPLVKPKQVKENLDFDGLDFKQLLSIAPFIDDNVLSEFLLDMKSELSIDDLVKIIPFVDEEVVDTIVLGFIKEDKVGTDKVLPLIPFVSEDTVDLLANDLPEEEVHLIAPFLSEEKVNEIVSKAIAEGRMKDVMGLMPFTDFSFLTKDKIKDMFKK